MITRRVLLIVALSFLQLCAIGQIRIVFRYDDFKLNDTMFNDSLLSVFAKNNIPINLGIIPFDENDNLILSDSLQINKLKIGVKNKSIDFLLHGFNHQECSKGNSEFKGLRFSEQYERVFWGKHFVDSLFDISIKTFIPPWNTYDSATLKVLDSLEFVCISANKWGDCSSSKIKYLPYTYEGFYNIGEFIKLNKDSRAIIVILFHQYSFKPYYASYPVQKITFQKLDSLLSWINTNKIECSTFSEILENTSDLDFNRYQANISYVNSIANFISDKINGPLLNISVYYSNKYIHLINFLDWVIWILAFVAVFTGVYGFNRLFNVNLKLQILAISASLIVLTFIIHRRYYSMEWMIICNLVIFTTFSMIVVFCLNMRQKKINTLIS